MPLPASRLHMSGFDLAQLFVDSASDNQVGRQFDSPLEIVYLPIIRRQMEAAAARDAA